MLWKGSVVSKFEETTRLGFKKYKIEFVDMPQYFRPGMTFRGKVKTMFFYNHYKIMRYNSYLFRGDF